VLSVPQTGFTTHRKVLIYNYKDGGWTVFDHPSDAPQFISDYFNANYGHMLYATFYDGHIYHYCDDSYGSDWGTAIQASLTTKADDFGLPGYRKFMAQAWFLMPQTAGVTPLQLEVLRDEAAAPVINRSVSMDIADSAWKAYRLGKSGNPGTKLQLRLTYTGAPQIDLDQIHFEIGLLARRPGQPR